MHIVKLSRLVKLFIVSDIIWQ